MSKFDRIIKLLEDDGFEEVGICLEDDMSNNYISFEKDTINGVVTTNLTYNRVHQIFHDIEGNIELEASFGHETFIKLFKES